MPPNRPLPAGPLLSMLIDEDIAHIRRVMPLSLHGGPGGGAVDPLLSSAHWRMRLYRLLDTGHVNKSQLDAIDGLLLQLDAFDAHDRRAAHSRPAPQAPGKMTRG